MANTVQSFPLQDIFVGIILALAFIFGLIAGTKKKLTYLIILTLVMIVGFFIVVPNLSSYIRFNLLADLNKTISVTISGTTFNVYSINDLFVLFQNFNLDPGFLTSNCQGLCEAVSFIVLFVGALIVSYILYLFIYHLIVKRVFKFKNKDGSIRKPRFLSRFFGGILGVAQYLTILLVFFTTFGSVFSGMDSVLLEALRQGPSDSNSIYNLVIQFIDANTISSIIKYGEIVFNFFDPLSGNSHIIRPIIEFFQNMNFDILNIFKGATLSGTDNTQVEESSLYSGMNSLWLNLKETLDSSGI